MGLQAEALTLLGVGVLGTCPLIRLRNLLTSHCLGPEAKVSKAVAQAIVSTLGPMP